MILRALLLLPIAAGVLAGQQAFGESDKIAIEKMYSRYVTAFIKQDYTALRDSVQAPFVVSAGGALQSLGSVDAVEDHYRKQRGALEKRGYNDAKITAMRITALTPDSALINASYRRFKKDGSVLEEGAAVYPVCKSSGAWKLCGVMGQDPRHFGKMF